MKTPPNTLLDDFPGKTELSEAIVANHPGVFYHLAKGIMECEAYSDLRRDEGRMTAYRILAETLIIFRRQIRHAKAEISIQGSLVRVNKHHELSGYLNELFLLIVRVGYTSKIPETLQKPDFDFRKVFQLKEKVLNTLYSLGLTSGFNPEEVFQDSVTALWEKIHRNEIGLFQKTESAHPDHWYAYNRRFYHSSRLSTFLTGIAKNIILQGIRFQKIRESESIEDLENVLPDPASTTAPDPILGKYKYYRVFVEERKLRSVVSILHYDCGLEEKEVCHILGLNNARMHNARLKNNFNAWCSSQTSSMPDFFEPGEGYLHECYQKDAKLNAKFRMLHASDTPLPEGFVDLSAFQEEFRSFQEFSDNYLIFRNILFLLSKGKASNLTGLTGEDQMRSLLTQLKSGILSLPNRDSILYLFYYASQEPESAIIHLMNALKEELTEAEKSYIPAPFPEVSNLKNDMYDINHLLFGIFRPDSLFTQMI